MFATLLPRAGIPIHTPASLASEARDLRNALLSWRLRTRPTIAPDPTRALAGVAPRLNQTTLALLSLIDDEDARARIAGYLMAEDDTRRDEGASNPKVIVLSALVEAFARAAKPYVPVSEILDIFNRKTSGRFYLPVTAKWIGSVKRMALFGAAALALTNYQRDATTLLDDLST